MRAGVLKEKPLWYDVYKAFPPLREPVFQKPNLRYGKAKATIQDIFYHEDRIRAKFFSAYGSGPKAFDLFNPNFKSTCERFVEKYIELQNLGETNEEKLFVETGKALLAEGIILRRIGEARAVTIRHQAAAEGNQPQKDDAWEQQEAREEPQGACSGL
ncbi:28S ribosomal protein S23, mitochondrial isoform X3 [Nannospalax galili]|nr:28S ribosomal protein S23, mitochondrial isoform X3 [Nannospalax galili]